MDITRDQVAYILGIEDDTSLDARKHAKPMSLLKKGTLAIYIQKHEDKEVPKFFDSEGNACLLINKSLVFLEKGAGFGELALLSDTDRMTTCRANTKCSLGTLCRKNFSIILRRAQKRKIAH